MSFSTRNPSSRLLHHLRLLDQAWAKRPTAKERLRAEVGELTERKLQAMLFSNPHDSPGLTTTDTQRRPPHLAI